MSKLQGLLIVAWLACTFGCSGPAPETSPMESRSVENVSPEMLDRALKGLHSEDAKLQMSGLRFLESFPEIKQQHVARVEELKKSGKDSKVRSQAEKMLK